MRKVYIFLAFIALTNTTSAMKRKADNEIFNSNKKQKIDYNFENIIQTLNSPNTTLENLSQEYKEKISKNAFELFKSSFKKSLWKSVKIILMIKVLEKNQNTFKDLINSMTPLMLASVVLPEAVKHLIDNNLDSSIYTKDTNGSTALMFAAEYQPKAVKYLIQAGTGVNSKNKCGLTALMIAVIHQPKAVKHLIQAGADVNAKDDNGWTALMLAARFQPEAVKYLIQAGADVNAKSNNGWTALMKAAEYQPRVVKYLIQAGADVNAKNKYNLTALMLAAQFHPEAAKTLIISNAEIFMNNDFNIHRLLMEALKIKSLFELVTILNIKTTDQKFQQRFSSKTLLKKIIEFAKTGASLKTQDCHGNSLLHYAVLNNDQLLVATLLGYDPSLATIENNNGSTPVDLALKWEKHKIFKYFVNQAFMQIKTA